MAKKTNPLRAFAVFSALGIQIGIMVVGGGYLGTYLDEKLGTGEILTFLGVILGVALSMYFVLRTLKQINKDT